MSAAAGAEGKHWRTGGFASSGGSSLFREREGEVIRVWFRGLRKNGKTGVVLMLVYNFLHQGITQKGQAGPAAKQIVVTAVTKGCSP